MKNLIKFHLIGLCLLTFISCSKEEDPVNLVSPIRMEIEQVMSENNITEIWAVNAEICASVTWYAGTEDFEFLDYFVRIQDEYFLYERLVSFQTDTRLNGSGQMLLCFD